MVGLEPGPRRGRARASAPGWRPGRWPSVSGVHGAAAGVVNARRGPRASAVPFTDAERPTPGRCCWRSSTCSAATGTSSARGLAVEPRARRSVRDVGRGADQRRAERSCTSAAIVVGDLAPQQPARSASGADGRRDQLHRLRLDGVRRPAARCTAVRDRPTGSVPREWGEAPDTRAADAYKLGLVIALRLLARSHDARAARAAACATSLRSRAHRSWSARSVPIRLGDRRRPSGSARWRWPASGRRSARCTPAQWCAPASDLPLRLSPRPRDGPRHGRPSGQPRLAQRVLVPRHDIVRSAAA